MNASLLNSICYTVGWFWCVYCGVYAQSLLALLGTIILIFVQLYNVKSKDTALYIQDFLLVLFSIPMGFFLETLFIHTGLLHYANSNNVVPPLWIIYLYPLFSLVLNHSLQILKKSFLLPFMFGLLFAPLSYIAGVSLGGVNFNYSLMTTYISLGLLWGLFLWLLTKIANSIDKATTETLADLNSKSNLKLLYDGECPICNREICYLRKKDTQDRVDFVDITSKDYTPSQHKNISYKTAMSQMHAIDANDNILVGVPAFANVYARCHMLVISTLMRIPFIQWILKKIYKVFAKNRYWITRRK